MMRSLRSPLCGVVLFSLACKQPQPSPGAAAAPAAQVDAAVLAAPAAPVDPQQESVLISGQHDTLSAARLGLEAALKLPVDLPLPFPRVEHHADGFRVVLARGRASELATLVAALQAAGQRVTLAPAGQAGGDDVIRLGIVCTDGAPAPLYQSPLARDKDGALRELARLPTGQVVVPKEEDEAPAEADEGDRGGRESSAAAESGYLTVLQPRAGLLPGPTVLLPADCTPRDEDNDDGNGRLLQGGRLCLTTRFSGKQGQVPHADLLAVTPNYRRCVRFLDAGTFDGFDHDAARTQFAVEAPISATPATPTASTPTGGSTAVDAGGRPAAGAAKTARAPQLLGLHIYAVSPRGELLPRGQLPGLQRPAYLGDHLVAVVEPLPRSPAPAGPGVPSVPPPGLVVLDGIARLTADAAAGTPLPTPRRIFSFAPGTFSRLIPKVATYRPAAPTLQDGRVHASFQESCRPDGEKRVRAAAKGDFIQCIMEVEVEVGLDGTRPQQHCRLDNAQNNLDEPLPIPCPS